MGGVVRDWQVGASFLVGLVRAHEEFPFLDGEVPVQAGTGDVEPGLGAPRGEQRGAVGAGGGDGLAVWAEGDGVDGTLVGEGCEGFAEGVPDSGRVVATGGGDGLAVWAEGDGVDGALVGEGCEGFAGGIPEAGSTVGAGGGDGLAIWAEGDGDDGALMGEGGEGFAGGVPETSGAVSAGSGDGRAVGAEGDRDDLRRRAGSDPVAAVVVIHSRLCAGAVGREGERVGDRS